MKIVHVMSVALLFLASACSNQEKTKIPIAIVTPVTHPSLEQIEKGFKETMEAEHPGRYSFETYNAQGNKILMRAEIDEIVEKKYPLIFTIGTSTSQMTSEVLAKKKLITPQVFTAVNDPAGFHIVASEQSPGGNVTGVKELLDFRKELDFVLKCKPDIKTILLVYNPMEPGLAKDQKEVLAVLKEHGIELMCLEVFQTNELLAKVSSSPFIKEADALIVLKDNTVVGGLDILVKLCNQMKIPLIASDLDSPDRGAAIGFGVHEIDFGIEAAKKALEILQLNRLPGSIPVTPVSNFTFKINPQAARLQGLRPSSLGGAVMTLATLNQALIFLPLVIGGYCTLSLLKLPDLSLESAYLFGAVVAATHQNLPLPLLLVLAFLGGSIVGAFVAFLYRFLKLPFLLGAIATNGLFHGLTQYLLGTSIKSFHPLFAFSELSLFAVVGFFLVLVVGFCLRSSLGYSLAIYGNNPQFFQHHPISANYVIFFGMMAGHGCAGVAGFFFALSNGFVDLTMNFGIILLTLTALILGKLFVPTNHPNIVVALVGLAAYLAIQQALFYMGLNLRYYNAFQALFVLTTLALFQKKQKILTLNHLGV